MSKNKLHPLVSIITAVYNRADLLEETILSVLRQDYPNFEYIVLDDGSKDESLAVIKKYRQKLIWRTHKNMGEAKTVNKGFKMAKGEIVCVVSSDDPLKPKAISAAAEFLQKNPQVIVAYPDWEMINAQGKKIQHVKTFPYSYANMLRWHHCFPGPGTFIRRSVIKALKGRDPQFKYVSDFDFWLRGGLIGPFARIPKTLALYRFHPSSATVSSAGRAMADEHIKLVKKIYALPNLTDEAKKLKREALSSAYYIAGVTAGPSLPFFRLKLYLWAFLSKPNKYFGEYRERAAVIAHEFLNIPFALGYLLKSRITDGKKTKS